MKPSAAEQVTQLVAEVVSLPHLLGAIRTATPHDWLCARRTVVLLINRLDREQARIETNYADYAAKRPMYARVTVNLALLLFPLLLSAVMKPECRQ